MLSLDEIRFIRMLLASDALSVKGSQVAMVNSLNSSLTVHENEMIKNIAAMDIARERATRLRPMPASPLAPIDMDPGPNSQ